MSDIPHARRSRDAMFFVSDVRGAAETAAYELEEHGLDPDSVSELADEIEATITKFFAETNRA